MIEPYSHKPDYLKYKDQYDKAIFNEISKGDFVNGESVKKLEKQLENYLNVKNAICVSSGTDALLLSLLALDIKKGDEVITTPLTWISTSEVILFLGAKPIFVDIDRETYNIDYTKIEEKITEKTKVILPVSLFGQICDLEKIMEIAKKYNLYVIEDGAQSFGSINKNIKSCSYADISCTSFYPTKPLGCWGDGGACFTNNEKLAYKIKCLRNHGGIKRDSIKFTGLNSRMDSIQASILIIKLNHLDESLDERIKIANRYNEKLKNIDNLILPKNFCDKHVYAQYTVLMKNEDIRNKFRNFMEEKGIRLSIFYPKPLYEEIPIKKFKSYCKNTDEICDRCISLTCYDGLNIEDQDYIISKIKKFFNI